MEGGGQRHASNQCIFWNIRAPKLQIQHQLSMTTQIPPEVFFSSMDKIRQTWENKFPDQIDSIILANGKVDPGNEKTTAIISWIFGGYNLTDTILNFTKDKVIIYTSERKIKFLSPISEHPNAKKFNLSFVKKADENTENFSNIWADLHPGLSSPRVGFFVKDTKVGAVVEEFEKFLGSKAYVPYEVSHFFNECVIIKGKDDLDNLRRSAMVTTYFLSKFIKEVEKSIDDGSATSHKDLTAAMNKNMGTEAELKKCTVKLSSNSSNLSINKDFIDTGASISVQSGGNYSPKLFVESNSDPLRSDCIVLGLGTLYKSWNSYVGRTLLINPTEKQKVTYKKVLALAKVIQQNLRPGVAIHSIYKKAAQFVGEHLPGVEVPKSFGFGIGVYLCQSLLEINETNTRVIEPGYSFLISLNFPNLEYETKKDKKNYAIQITDTVIVSDKGQQVLTAGASTSISDISYDLGDEDEEKKEPKRNTNNVEHVEGRPTTRRGKKHEATMQKMKNQKKRAEHQLELKKKKLEELKERVNENFIGDFKKQKNIEGGKLESYRSREDFPREMKKNQIYVDAKNNSILLPISGRHVPFNIHILKSVVKNREGKFVSLRFNFHLPGAVPNFNFPKFSESCVFVKEMVFRSQQGQRIEDLEKQIKALQKKVKLDLTEKNAKEDIVEQETLRLNKGKRPTLRDLFARPGIGQKRVKGNLECHLNGFRYATIKGEIIDVAFSNIKYAFFQPCEKEIIAAIHFRLHEPILIGKKKSEDVQFFSEGGPNAEDIGGRGRAYGDDEDDEERQKETRRRLDKEFMTWIKSCEQFKGRTFNFETPDRDAGFYGNPYNNTTLLQPTQSCLINVTENRFFVASIDQIEIACFERMYANVKSFDVILLMKDYETFMKISSIPIKDVEKVKDWLDSRNIIFYDQGKNLNWAKFLTIIRKDFKKFVDDGAWMAWDEADQEEEEHDQDLDESFSVSESDFDEDSDDSDSDSLEEENESDDDSSAEEDLSEEGLSSDELDERAEMEDRERDRKEVERQREREKGKKR